MLTFSLDALLVDLDAILRRGDAEDMAKKPKRLPRDVNARAFAIGQIATGDVEVPDESTKATAGRKGGKKGGNARAARLSDEDRSAIAKKAAIPMGSSRQFWLRQIVRNYPSLCEEAKARMAQPREGQPSGQSFFVAGGSCAKAYSRLPVVLRPILSPEPPV